METAGRIINLVPLAQSIQTVALPRMFRSGKCKGIDNIAATGGPKPGGINPL